MFKPVPSRVDYVQLDHEVQAFWDANDTMSKYLKRNDGADKRFSFIDGPITANNPMGVHHAWGRTYKDTYQRFKTMQGYKQRYQNGFDCQGLWIEVEVEKEFGFTSKKDIERYGIADFVEACKERVRRFAAIQTEQSKRLAYWMNWDNSYYTNSDENNYTIWAFLKKVWSKGWLYKGKDSMPWCPRCGTGISQHEIVTEGYKDITHQSVYVKFPIIGRVGDDGQPLPRSDDGGQTGNRAIGPSQTSESVAAGFNPQDGNSTATAGSTSAAGQQESLLVWTTTPWTLAANIAAAVNPDLTYVKVRQGDDVLYVSSGAVATAIRGEHEVIGEVKGSELVGLQYSGPFDELGAQIGVVHRVIRWDDVSDAEGTGIVHIAPGAGAEDFALSKEYGLEIIAPLEEDGTYIVGDRVGMRTGFGFLEGQFAGDVAPQVFDNLREKGLLYRVQAYEHRYPTCWRCSSELVFRLVDEWFISMDGHTTSDPASPTLREKIIEISDKVNWIPEFGKARERDWLRNMHDWMISKKRYYGLALPIYECKDCGHFEVIGSETELQERAVAGWEQFEGHSPHRPRVDAVLIACSKCGSTVQRIRDVGNPWLDAGIVPFSTLNYRNEPDYWREWFPADWVSESFPGQFRNWFYSLLAMGTVMVLDTKFEGTPPFQNLFSYALLRDEHGEEMHKSKGNAIWFEDAADKMGVDVMRWLYLRTPPANNLNFGYGPGDELKRGFLSTLWNTVSFFVTYANIDGWVPRNGQNGKGTNGQSRNAESVAAGFNPQSDSNNPQADTQNPQNASIERSDLDRWVLSELNRLVRSVTIALESYDSMAAARQIEDFIEGLSNWYVRRSRRRFWKPVLSTDEGTEADGDKQAAYDTLYTCLETVNRLMAPMTPFMAEELYQSLVRSWDTSAPESVHLVDWPAVDAALIDERLSSSMDVVQRLASLGRAARAKSNLKVRQPLSTLIVRLPTASGELLVDIRGMSDELLDELNIKRLEFLAPAGEDGAGVVTGSGDASGRPRADIDIFEFQVRLNLPVLGAKHGSDMGRLQRAFGSIDRMTVARRKLAGLIVNLDGIDVFPEELLVTISGKPGYAVAEEAGYAVAVTTEITPELADEGLARELVRRIQEMRKTAGFEIADRIRLGYEGDDDLTRVMGDWGEYISQETLAEAIAAGTNGGHVEEHEIDGRKVKLGVQRVG